MYTHVNYLNLNLYQHVSAPYCSRAAPETKGPSLLLAALEPAGADAAQTRDVRPGHALQCMATHVES